MSTTLYGHRPSSHGHFRNLVQVGYLSSRSAPQVETQREEALLSISTYSGIPGFFSTKPFYLPPRNPNDGTHGAVEKGLGYGAFGVVWSVIDPRDGQKVALKRIPRAFHNAITAKRVYREFKMLSCLKHDNLGLVPDLLSGGGGGVIVNLIDVVKTERFMNFDEMYPFSIGQFSTTPSRDVLVQLGLACFLFELMQTDLHKIIVSPQPLSLDHVKIFVYQILRGLKYLHSARIIHRDIKPGNMLVNSNCLLKICDFGLARMDDPYGEALLTQEVVTQYYRSPELLMEATRYSYAVDIWSVGCTFAELLGRRILFPVR
ncbi:unnamed protein product [Echinostoma caproni]|uniref:Protein kinase domain-containing protein n=1 Tax=Echinostoma caproni TaxID=27848 RepID=A0A183AGI2_9TREM|nr:unnamed protein product [Echinostoma caproni]